MGKFLRGLLSIRAMNALLLIFAFACAVATIVESVKGTDAAFAFIYRSNWFGLIMLLLTINLIYNMIRYKIYGLKKLPGFLFHFSFIVIFVGATMTHYFGKEGSMHIREHTKTNLVSTREVYIQLISEDEKGKTISKDVNRYIATNEKNSFDIKLDLGKKDAVLKYKELVLNGDLGWIKADDGKPIVELLFSDDKNKRKITLNSGDILPIGDLDITFNNEPKQHNFIKIYLKDDGKFYMQTNQDIKYFQMSDNTDGKLKKNTEIDFNKHRLYTIDGVNFAPTTMLAKAKLGVKPVPMTQKGNNAIIGDLTYNGETKEVFAFFGDFARTYTVGGKEFKFAWSPKMIELPFSIYLKDFKLDRYPGSNSPSGYSSEVVVEDGDFKMDYEIYMNHVLDYGGFRFFQSSYDLDEKGTILSVNKDPGKIPTYIGYFLLMLGMFLNFFNKNSRFLELARLIDKSSSRDRKTVKKENNNVNKKALSLILVAFFSFFTANNLKANDIPNIDKEHAKKAATLVVQGFDGRMEPFDTMANEILRKVYKGKSFEGMNAVQTMLSITMNPESWQHTKFVKIGDDELKKILGLKPNETHASFEDFFGTDENGKSYYKLGLISEQTNRKAPNTRTKFDKEVIKVDERFNIYYATLMKSIFKIIPKENDPNHTWYAAYGVMTNFSAAEEKRAKMVLQNYTMSVLDAQKSGNWSEADKALDLIKKYQNKIGAKVVPSYNKLKFEVLFNDLDIFKRLMPVYLLGGFALLIFVFLRMMSPNLNMNFAFKAVYLVNIIAFLLHTTGLGLRWYISGHAPWSNTYESLVYIAWALSFSGIIFSRTSAISLSLTSIMAGITLFVAHLSHIDPQITTLVPVLNSYWLTIHVSVITASYGFFGLSMLLAMFCLFLFIIKKPGNDNELARNILEATRINEMSLIFGLCLLTAGNFLGGVWANESWGRYWGWDSKETWSLITILIYSAVIHMRLLKGANSQYWFSVASMFAFWSVMMTYFGVNFYLSGLHSYASGDAIPVPKSIWVSMLVMIILATLAYFKRKDAQKL